MSASRRLEVPQELTDLLLDFTVAVLVGKPADLSSFAADYFAELARKRAAAASAAADGSSNHMPDEDAMSADFRE